MSFFKFAEMAAYNTEIVSRSLLITPGRKKFETTILGQTTNFTKKSHHFSILDLPHHGTLFYPSFEIFLSIIQFTRIFPSAPLTRFTLVA